MERFKNLACASYLNETSVQMAEQQRVRQIMEIFSILDSDEDGIVKECSMELLKLPPRMAKLLLPFIHEIDSNKLELNFE